MQARTFLPYGKQSITSEDIQEVVKVLESDWITRGPKVQEFEEAIAEYCEAKFAVAFTNGTAALMAACHAAEMGPYDRFLTSPNTFVATVTAGMSCQSTPVFVDIDRNTGNIDLDQVEATLKQQSSRGRDVVMPVHFSGIPVDMRRLDRAIKDPNTLVIEDAAHALGSSYSDGQKIGSCAYSTMTTFSFHPVKNITTGEGGIVTTNDPKLHHRLQRFRDNGIEREPQYLEKEATPWYYEVQELTGNYHFTDVQAALGLSQLKRLDQIIEKRRKIVERYRQKIQGIPNIQLFTSQCDNITAFHLFVLQIDFDAFQTTRSEVMNQLKEKDIGTQVHYIPVYHHPFFKKVNGDISEYFPKMEAYYSQALSLPLYSEMSFEDVDYIADILKEVLNAKG